MFKNTHIVTMHATTQEYKNTQYRHGKESKKKYIYIYMYEYEINNTEQNKTDAQTRTRQS